MSQTPDLVWSAAYYAAMRDLDAAEKLKAAAQAKLDAVQDTAKIACCKCKQRYLISTQEYIQTHWYTSPHGCTGGDYWNSGEGQWICPGCSFKHRFDDNADRYQTMANEFHKPEIVAMKYKFGSIRNCYCEWDKICKECRERAAK